MKRRNALRIASFLTAALLVSLGFIGQFRQKAERYRLELENGYSRNLEELCAAMNNISTTLNKGKYATTPRQISSMAAKLLSEAEISKTALSQLPVGEELTSLNKFLSQVGNYAMAVSSQLIGQGAVDEQSVQNIALLSQTADKITQAVNDSQIIYNNVDYWAKELDREVGSAVEQTGLSSALSDIEDEFSDYPTLVYDGPYSDHILEKKPTVTEGAEEVSVKEAAKTAAFYAECDEEELYYSGNISGSIPAYRFTGSAVTATVSKNGGQTVFVRKERTVGDALLSYEQARQKAKRYLERTGMYGFKETYYFTTEGVCVVNFAFLDGETICYTDLVKVGVAMDNGEIMLYEASGYLSNHTERAFETPLYTLEQAEEIISDTLTIKSTALALIPTSGKNEARCYEFTCTSADGQEILVYINTQTLAEEEIFILLKEDGGTLVK